MAISVPQTASFDANLAHEVGLPAAILYNQLLFESQTDTATDYAAETGGWFYYTAKHFEKMTTYNERTYTNAVKKLVEVGFVEKKKCFRIGTTKPLNHFRFLRFYTNTPERDAETPAERRAETIIEDYKETNICVPPQTGKTATGDGLSSFGSTQNGCSGGQTVNATSVKPFEMAVSVADVKHCPDTPRSFALAQQLVAIVNPREKDLVTVARNIRGLWKLGYTDLDLKQAAKLSREDDYYYDKPCSYVISKDGVKNLLAKLKKKQRKEENVAVGMRRDGTYYKMANGEQVTITEEEYQQFKKRNI